MLVGLAGDDRSGKGSVAELLRDEYGFEIYSMAGAMKQMLGGILLLTREQLYGRERDKPIEGMYRDVSTRDFLLAIGGGARSVMPDVWVLIMARRLASLLEEGKNVVIDDVRYLNEVWWIKSVGGKVIRLIRTPSVSKNSYELPLMTSDLFDAVLEAESGKVDQLLSKADATFKTLLAK